MVGRSYVWVIVVEWFAVIRAGSDGSAYPTALSASLLRLFTSYFCLARNAFCVGKERKEDVIPLIGAP